MYHFYAIVLTIMCSFISYTFNKRGNCNEDIENGPVNRLSRFVLPESNKVNLSSETVFFETSALEYDHHNSGDIEFGVDGNMWVTVGDGGSTWTAVSNNPGNLLGSMVRLTLDGDIPADNPYVGDADAVRCNVNGVPPEGSPPGAKCLEIWATGLRNPFRFAIDPNVQDKVRFYVNDVGQGLWEEISEGGTDFKDVDYGWPAREGPCPNNRIENCADVHPYTDPVHFYIHNNGGSVTGGTFVPNGIWPEEYNGAYMYADFVFGKIYVLKDVGLPGCITCNPPESGMQVTEFTEWFQIVNMDFGPYRDTQALYYTGVYEIRRVSYVGDGNRSPDAIILAEPSEGPVGMTVMFSGAGSNDPDGDGLTFQWDFDGDGVVDSDEGNAYFTYNAAGLYLVSLTVNDGNGGSHTTTIEISVGNKPVPVITSVQVGATFAVGDVITLTGMATDTENGQLPDSALTWEVRQHHNTHYHPFLLPTEGNDIELPPAPEPEDYDAATNSYLEIILTATDLDGLSDTVSIDVQPRMVLVNFETIPTGLQLSLDGTSVKTPITATTWENHNLRVDAEDQLIGGIGSQAYAWSSWSDGGNQSHTINIPPDTGVTETYVAEFIDFFGTFPLDGQSLHPADCPPLSLGVVTDTAELRSGQTFESTQCNVYAEQRNDGNLVVSKGTPANPGDVIWESGYVGPEGDYFTWTLGNSNLITFQGVPPDAIGDVVFQTQTLDVDQDQTYYLGIDCTCTVVVVMQGTPEVPTQNVVWQSGPFPDPGDIPTLAPSAFDPSATIAPTLCLPGSLGIVAWQYEIAQGQVFINSNFEVYTEQQTDGNLVVRQGTPDQPGDIVWESGYSGEEGNYFSRALGNGNLSTYKGTQPENIEEEVWQTGTLEDEGLFFFGIDCSGNVGVIEGTPEQPGDFVWQGYSVTVVPTMAPSEVTASTTAKPTRYSDAGTPTSTPTKDEDIDSLSKPPTLDRGPTQAPTSSLFVGDLSTRATSSAFSKRSIGFVVSFFVILLSL